MKGYVLDIAVNIGCRDLEPGNEFSLWVDACAPVETRFAQAVDESGQPVPGSATLHLWCEEPFDATFLWGNDQEEIREAQPATRHFMVSAGQVGTIVDELVDTVD